MSATTSGRRAPRVTARVRTSISSIVAGTVESWPRTVIAAESPTRISRRRRRRREPAGGASYAVTIAIGCRRAFSSASSGSASLPGAGVPGRACGDGWSCGFLLEDDVVDQAGGADADGGGELGDRSRRSRRSRRRARRVPTRAAARSRVASARGSAKPRARPGRGALRDESARPSASRTVGTDRPRARGRGRARAAGSRPPAGHPSGRVGRSGRTMLKSFRHTVATPRKWPGR